MKPDIYRSSRIYYIIEAAVEYFISLLITGAYLAKLTSYLGFSDSLTAILTSFVALGCSFQLFAIAIFNKGRVKRKVTILHVINQLLFMLVYAVPFFNSNHYVKTALFIVFLLGGYFISNIINAPKINWFMSLVPDEKRGIFTSVKEMVSLIGGVIFQLAAGSVIDAYEAQGNMRGAFSVFGITIFVLMVIHTLTLILSKEKDVYNKKSGSSLGGFKSIISDRHIMMVIFASVFWTICTHITTSFFGTYQIKELGFDMTFVALLSVAYTAVRVPSSLLLGKYADKFSFAKMLKICYSLAAAAFLFATFTAPSNGKIFFTIYYMLFAAAMGGINSAEINLIFDYASPEKRQNALALKQTVYGLCGFLATLAATPLFNYIQNSGNTFFGVKIYAQQVLSAISFVMTILLIIYVDKVVLKIKPNESDRTH